MDRKSLEQEKREEGASLVEYALLVALIAVVCIAAISFLGGAVSEKFSTVGSAID
ncbi:MAG: Flp family type IVb pilin [Bdellovibrionales bacterium]|nr:Flp family type IVb pilin [Bdellovibrionales bacterium]